MHRRTVLVLHDPETVSLVSRMASVKYTPRSTSLLVKSSLLCECRPLNATAAFLSYTVEVMVAFHIERHYVDLRRVGEPLTTLAQRYTPLLKEEVTAQPPRPSEAYVFVFTHALASRRCVATPRDSVPKHGLYFADKETWEPVISRLFELQNLDTGVTPITEMWTLDCPDHGESAALNRSVPASALRAGRVCKFVLSVLPRRLWVCVACRSYGGAILSLARSVLMDNSPHTKLVLIGHSAGSIGTYVQKQ